MQEQVSLRENKWAMAEAGLTCASVGHVSSKASSSGGDLCATDMSHWGINFNAGPNSGTTYTAWKSPWSGSDRIELYGQSRGTNICGSQARCTAWAINVSDDGDGDGFDNVWVCRYEF